MRQMRPTTSPLLFLLLALAALPAPAADSVDAPVRGAPSCGEWVAQRKKADTLALSNANWLLGYLSGLGAGSGRNVLGGRDNAAVFAAMDKYCSEHPFKDAAAGGAAMLEASARRKDSAK